MATTIEQPGQQPGQPLRDLNSAGAALWRSPQPKRHRTSAQRARTTGMYAILLGVTLVFVAPFAWLIIISLKQLGEMATFPIQWLPKIPQWQNYQQVFAVGGYWTWVANSLILATLNAGLTMLSSAAVGFGFARLKAPGKRFVFVMMLSTLMLPGIITLIPTYIIFSRLGLTDTYWPWIIWGLASSAYLVFLFRQFFAAIPQELEDAAIVDGAGYLRIFWQIFMPLSLPVLATAFILQFTYTWGDYLSQSLLLTQDNWTLAVAMASGVYTDPHSNPLPNIQAAASIFYILPVMVLFFVSQRFFIRGIVTTGLKG